MDQLSCCASVSLSVASCIYCTTTARLETPVLCRRLTPLTVTLSTHTLSLSLSLSLTVTRRVSCHDSRVSRHATRHASEDRARASGERRAVESTAEVCFGRVCR